MPDDQVQTEPSASRPAMVQPTKVFCIGFQKTGTSSMRDALEHLGFRVAGYFGYDADPVEFRHNFVGIGLETAARFDAVEDMPWPLMYRELDRAFPGSKFILTVRDTDSWYRSITLHFGGGTHHLQQLTYGEDAPSPTAHEARYREVYETHNRTVAAYFADRPGDLLVMDLEKGDGWAALGGFLGKPVPDGPFIRTNTSAQRRSLNQRIRRRLQKMGMPISTMDR